MTNKNLRIVLSFTLIVAFSIAFIDSAARAENERSVSYRTNTVDGVDVFIVRPTTGAEADKRDLDDLEFHLLDTGHFALETHGQEIADLMRDFLNRKIQSPVAAN